MKFDNQLEVPLPPAEAWPVFLDIRRVAGCIPGVELTEVVDERTYKGKFAVRVGPVALSFVGQVRLEEIDDANRRALVKAQGSDPKGRGSTDSLIEFRLEPTDIGTRVLIHSDVKLAGPIAQYGRAAGIMQSIASQLIAQFGVALKAQMGQEGSGHAPQPTEPISGLKALGKAVVQSIVKPSGKR